MKRHTISTDLVRKNFTNTKLTFSIEHIKCNGLAMVKPVLKLYTTSKTYITQYTGNWWVISKDYLQRNHTFNINKDTLNRTGYYQISLIAEGLNPENRLEFNHLQLCEGSNTKYHQPEADIPKTEIKFTTNFYANLYTSNEENYLQVIRPSYNSIDTETITKSKTTVLAPHLANEDIYDSPSNIGLEYMNSTDQVIEILR